MCVVSLLFSEFNVHSCMHESVLFFFFSSEGNFRFHFLTYLFEEKLIIAMNSKKKKRGKKLSVFGDEFHKGCPLCHWAFTILLWN